MKKYHFKVGDIVLHSKRSGLWIIDHIVSNGTPMVKQICTSEGVKRIGKQVISGGPRCRPAQELLDNLQFIINKYNGINRQHD